MANSKTIYVGMSGGVDSSVVAYLLKMKNKDSEVVGVYANCFYEEAQCRSTQDHADATKVAAKLEIPLETKDYRQIYSDKVLQVFYDKYSKGLTPNPDILCNSEVKFGAMLSGIHTGNPGACLATGHYVGVRPVGKSEMVALLRESSPAVGPTKVPIGLIYRRNITAPKFLFSGKDGKKDQSYFLYRLYDKPEALDHIMFPLSQMSKAEVRSIAKEAKLPVASKPDSQGICFVGNVKLREFIKDQVISDEGRVVNVAGEVIGSHSGVSFYTIGQRHGFTVSSYSPEPLYIVDKIPEKNLLVVGSRSQAYVSKFSISDVSFPYNIEEFLETFNDFGLSVRVRNLGRKIECRVVDLTRESGERKFQVSLAEPEFGVAPGQSAVFYIGDLMLGGGVIESSEKSFSI